MLLSVFTFIYEAAFLFIFLIAGLPHKICISVFDLLLAVELCMPIYSEKFRFLATVLQINMLYVHFRAVRGS